MGNHDTGEAPRTSVLQDRLDQVRRSLDALGHPGEAATATLDGSQPISSAAVMALREEVAALHRELEGLSIAMVNRGVIEQAKGMLMLRLKIDEDKAFAYLREMSNRTNRRVVEIAADVVNTRAGEISPA
jgi:hypothetical protein